MGAIQNGKNLYIYKSFSKSNQNIELLRIDSHNPATLELVKKHLGNRMIDVLFIDGDHTYEGVKQDFEMYSGLVKKGGIIAFHDIVDSPILTCNVDKYWNEIKKDFKSLEIIENLKQRWAGIGLIYL